MTYPWERTETQKLIDSGTEVVQRVHARLFPKLEPLELPPDLVRDKDNIAPYMRRAGVSPSKVPPASPPSWVPPWGSKT